MSMGQGNIRRSANLLLLLVVTVLALGGMLIVVGLLGAFLLPLTFVFFWLVIIYFIGADRISGVLALGGLIVVFLFGYGVHVFLGSTLGYDPAQAGYTAGLTAVRLSPLGFNLSDSEFSTLLGFIVIFAVIVFAFAGLLMQMKARRTR